MTIAASDGTRLAVISSFGFEVESGSENAFRLSLPIEDRGLVSEGCFVYVDGTDVGGVVDSSGVDYSRPDPASVFVGRTWRGILARRVVVPGGDRYHAAGDANRAIERLLGHVGVGWPFEAEAADCGVEVECDLPRFCTLLEGLERMLGSGGLSLSVTRAYGRVTLSARQAREEAVITPESCSLSYMHDSRPVNHLVCAGEGEGGERAVVHLYADASGAVSREQSLFGLDEVAELYSFTTADEGQLVEYGSERLSGYQVFNTASAEAPEGLGLQVGGRAVVRIPGIGKSVSMVVESASLVVEDRRGIETYSFGDDMTVKEARLWP